MTDARDVVPQLATHKENYGSPMGLSERAQQLLVEMESLNNTEIGSIKLRLSYLFVIGMMIKKQDLPIMANRNVLLSRYQTV